MDFSKIDTREIFEALDNTIYFMDIQGRIIWCNKEQLKVFGLEDSNELVGKNIFDVGDLLNWPRHIPIKIHKNDLKVLKGETMILEEIVVIDGKKRIFLSRKKPYYSLQGNIVGIIGIGVDITKGKEAEKLAQEKIIADRTIQTLQSLAGSLSHELRTPLAGIDLVMQSNGATIQSLMHFQEDVLAGREPWPVTQEGINDLKAALPKIKQQLKNAEIIIDLQLQSIHDKKIDTRLFAQYSMANIINSALEQYPFSKEQRLLIHWSDKKNFTFWGESYLMLNVLYNLIKNALYFIKEAGKGEIFISIISDDKYNYLHFKDTAMGMPPEIAVKVFDKFYTKTRHGTGLGLAFCKNVMDAFKGDILCRSEEGVYAEFILLYPKREN